MNFFKKLEGKSKKVEKEFLEDFGKFKSSVKTNVPRYTKKIGESSVKSVKAFNKFGEHRVKFKHSAGTARKVMKL